MDQSQSEASAVGGVLPKGHENEERHVIYLSLTEQQAAYLDTGKQQIKLLV